MTRLATVALVAVLAAIVWLSGYAAGRGSAQAPSEAVPVPSSAFVSIASASPTVRQDDSADVRPSPLRPAPEDPPSTAAVPPVAASAPAPSPFKTAPAAGGGTDRTGTPSGRTVRGIASYVGAFLGSRYLALPQHRWGRPGLRVRICGPAGCITRTSTDAGPDKAMQRRGRIADLSRRDFAIVCGCTPERVGLVRVRVTYL